MKSKEEHLIGVGSYIKEIVYGASDGIITTFAIVTGSLGANLSPSVILILGFANLIADGISMGASNFLSSRSEDALYRHEAKREETHTENVPHKESEEVKIILQERGFSESDSLSMTKMISSNRPFWVDFMMKYEHEMQSPDSNNALKQSIVTFVSFVIAGSLPILPYAFLAGKVNVETYSIVATAVALFTVGALRFLVTKVNWFVSGLEMLLIGGVAALASYGIGAFIASLV